MRSIKRIGVFLIAMIVLMAGMVISASAQRRVRSVQRVVHKPVIVRRVYWRSPFYRRYYDPFYSRYYDPFYDPYFYDPYLRARRERAYLEDRVRGNERELRKHREKYGRDGVITAKERRELDDDIRDVQRSRARLREFNSVYSRNY